MNILNRNRNRRKVSASRLSTSADPCETRSLLCAAALPVAELIETPVDDSEVTAQSESAELVECLMPEDIYNVEVCTFDIADEPVDVTAYSDEVFPVETGLTEEDLAKLAAGLYTMFNAFSVSDGDAISPEISEDYQPEIAICDFGPEMQFDENGNPIDVTSEVELDPALYDITTLEGWDPSWAFRGVVVDGSEEVPGNIPVEESGEYTGVDWAALGFEDLDGDGVPDGLAWTSGFAEDVVNEPGFPSDLPFEGDPGDLPIYWFGVADGGVTEVDEFGNPIYYMTSGIPEGGESPEEGFVDGEVKITFEDIVEFDDSTLIDPTVGGPIDENGDVIPVRYFSLGGPEMLAVQRSLDTVSGPSSEPVSLVLEHPHQPDRLPLVRIPVTRPQSSVFETQTSAVVLTPPTVPSMSAQFSPDTSSPETPSPVEAMPVTTSSRLRLHGAVRIARPFSPPTTGLNSLSPLLGTETSEESQEDVSVPQSVDDVVPVTPEGKTEQPTTWVPARERRSIDMFMSDFADDGYIG